MTVWVAPAGTAVPNISPLATAQWLLLPCNLPLRVQPGHIGHLQPDFQGGVIVQGTIGLRARHAGSHTGSPAHGDTQGMQAAGQSVAHDSVVSTGGDLLCIQMHPEVAVHRSAPVRRPLKHWLGFPGGVCS